MGVQCDELADWSGTPFWELTQSPGAWSTSVPFTIVELGADSQTLGVVPQRRLPDFDPGGVPGGST
jgi:hypothetical protein